MEKGWIRIYSTNQIFKASMAVQLLNEQDIRTVTINNKNEVLQIGEIEIYVKTTDVQKAISYLKNVML